MIRRVIMVENLLVGKMLLENRGIKVKMNIVYVQRTLLLPIWTVMMEIR